MTDEFKFGELICYRDPGGAALHDRPTMYLGECHHPRVGSLPSDIDFITLPEGLIEHKDPAMWQRCGHFPAERTVRVLVDGVELDPSEYTYSPGSTLVVNKPIWGDVRVEYEDDGSVMWMGRFP